MLDGVKLFTGRGILAELGDASSPPSIEDTREVWRWKNRCFLWALSEFEIVARKKNRSAVVCG